VKRKSREKSPGEKNTGKTCGQKKRNLKGGETQAPRSQTSTEKRGGSAKNKGHWGKRRQCAKKIRRQSRKRKELELTKEIYVTELDQ